MPFAMSLKSCWAKLRQARAHRATLIAQVERHFGVSANRPTLIAELDSASGDHVFRIAGVPSTVELQEILAVTVGDAVHNLRSALDHLVFQLACVNTNGSPKDERNIQFPIADSRDVYASQARRYLQEVDKTRQATIESYQPYHGAASRPDNYSGPYIHQLTLLRDMSNSDKHRLLNIVLIIPGGAEFSLPAGVSLTKYEPRTLDEMRKTNPFRNAGDELEVGVEVLRQKLVGQDVPSAIPGVGHVVPQFALEEKRALVPTLARIESFVELILSDFSEKLSDQS
jgi:hypothetical protein